MTFMFVVVWVPLQILRAGKAFYCAGLESGAYDSLWPRTSVAPAAHCRNSPAVECLPEEQFFVDICLNRATKRLKPEILQFTATDSWLSTPAPHSLVS